MKHLSSNDRPKGLGPLPHKCKTLAPAGPGDATNFSGRGYGVLLFVVVVVVVLSYSLSLSRSDAFVAAELPRVHPARVGHKT